MNIPEIGAPKFAKSMLLTATEEDGSTSNVIVPQVFVAQINLPLIQELVARTAVATTIEISKIMPGLILKALADAGILPAPSESKADESLVEAPTDGEASPS